MTVTEVSEELKSFQVEQLKVIEIKIAELSEKLDVQRKINREQYQKLVNKAGLIEREMDNWIDQRDLIKFGRKKTRQLRANYKKGSKDPERFMRKTREVDIGEPVNSARIDENKT